MTSAPISKTAATPPMARNIGALLFGVVPVVEPQLPRVPPVPTTGGGGCIIGCEPATGRESASGCGVGLMATVLAGTGTGRFSAPSVLASKRVRRIAVLAD